jgi:hypothetical protein
MAITQMPMNKFLYSLFSFFDSTGNETTASRGPDLDPILRLDYEQSFANFRMLADVRFKLLAFVPTISGAAIALISKDLAEDPSSTRSMMVLVVGLMGFLVTLGIFFYDQRNSQLSNITLFRLQALEKELKMTRHSPGDGPGGVSRERPGRALKFFGIWTIWHDRGLSLIYGSVLGAWLFPIMFAVFNLSGIEGLCKLNAAGLAGLLAAVGVVVFIKEFHRLDRSASKKPM